MSLSSPLPQPATVLVQRSSVLSRTVCVTLKLTGKLVTERNMQGRDIADLMFERLSRRVVASAGASADEPFTRSGHHPPPTGHLQPTVTDLLASPPGC